MAKTKYTTVDARKALNRLNLKNGVHFYLTYDTVIIPPSVVVQLCDWIENGISTTISEFETSHATAAELRADFLKKDIFNG